MLAVMVMVGFLLLLEPDMGAFVVVCAIALCTLWLGGFNIKVFAALLVALPLLSGALLMWANEAFDRLLVAQAQTLPARLLTSDAALPAYSDLVSLIAVR